MTNYEDLVKRARKILPEKMESHARFEIPKVKGRIQGKKTLISNLKQISDYLARDTTMVFKALLKELATKGVKDGNFYIFNGKFGASLINAKIEKYVKEFVTCRECKKPDTKLEKQGRVMFIKCMACGAKYPIRK